LAGTSPPVELVLALAVQPVSASAVSAADAGELMAWIAIGARPKPVANATSAQLAKRTLRCRTKLPILLMVDETPSGAVPRRSSADHQRFRHDLN
jgi:hypothetical protein